MATMSYHPVPTASSFQHSPTQSPSSQHIHNIGTAITTSLSPSAGSSYGHDLTKLFINAKRSLSSINLCARANSIVESTKAALEHTAHVASRCLFLRDAMKGQLAVIRQMNSSMHSVRQGFQSDFQNTLTELDNADLELKAILDHLKSTSLEPGFSPGHDEPRTLYDFVDDAGIEELKTTLRSWIDQVQTSQMTHVNMISNFDQDVHTLETTLANLPEPTSTSASQPSILDPKQNPVPEALDLFDRHAQNMAILLEQLTRHYDQCFDALKKTEVAAAHSSAVGLAESISVEEWNVLQKDAESVDDVMEELKEHLAEIEHLYANQVQAHLNMLDMCHSDALAAFSQFEEFQRNLGTYLVMSAEFESAQQEFRGRVEESLERLGSLTEYYTSFSRSYDKMIVEVGRRIGVKNRMEKIMKEAMTAIDELYDQDAAEREEFKRETGDFLPADIWTGLIDPPMKYKVEPVGGDLPELKKEILSKALRTLGHL